MKSKNDSYWLKSGIFSILQSMSGVFFGFFGFYILVRVLSKHDFGTWSLFMVTISIVEMIRTGMVQNALIKFLSFSPKEDHSKIIAASFSINGLLSLVCIVLNLFFSHYLSRLWGTPEIIPLFYLSNVYILLSGILTQFQCVEQANLQFKGLFIIAVLRQSIFFLFLFICFLIHFDVQLIMLVYIQIFTVLVSTVISYFSVKKYLSFSFVDHFKWVKDLFNYGKYTFGTSISVALANSLDTFMLGGMLSAASAGAYNIAVRITNLVDIPTSSVASIVFPQSALRMKTEGISAIKYLYEKSVGIILALLIPSLVLLFIFSGFVIDLIAGTKYQEVLPILKVTILYCLLIPFGRQFGTIIDSIGKPKLSFVIVVITASINMGLNYVMITRFGVVGAAYSTLVANSIGFIMAQVILRRLLKVNILNTFRYAFQFYPEFLYKYILHANVLSESKKRKFNGLRILFK